MNKYEILVAKAKQAYKEEDFENAASLYEEAFLEEVHLDDLLHLGAVYIDLKNYSKAISVFKDIISVQENNFLAYYGLASCYNDLGRYNDAIEGFKQAIKYKPDYADAYFGIGLLFDYQENDECEKYYLKTIEFEPDHYWANANLGPFYDRKQDYEKALKYAKKAYEIDPNGKLVSFNLGVIHEKLKDFDKAIDFYKEEISKEEAHIDAYLNIGLVYKDIFKDNNKAMIYYLEGISKDKDNVNLWYNLGCLYVVMNDLENAYNCLLYANLKDLKLREFMERDSELEGFRKTPIYNKLINTITG